MRTRRPAATTAALVVAGALLLSPGPVSAQRTRSELEAATARLRALERQIEGAEAQVARLKARLEDLQAEADRRRAEAAAVQRRLRATREELARTEAALREVRGRLASRARALYVGGPGSLFTVLLEARSLQDLVRRAAFAARVVRHDADLSLRVASLAAQLEERRAAESRLLAEKAALYKQTVRQQDALERVFAAQQQQVALLARARAELAGLVERLRDRLRAEELARAARVAGRGMPITYGQWAQAFLEALGAPVSRNNLVVVVAWEAAESTMATWNPLATTYPMPGATVYNSHGVRNYVSKEQGIEATILTLRAPGHGYEAVVSNLQASADPMTTAEAIRASDWCRGCARGTYVVGLVPAVQAYYERYAN